MSRFWGIALVLAIAPDMATAGPGETIAIVGGDVIMTPTQTVGRGTVLIRGGKIVAAGANVKIPKGARRIEAAGKTVSAGFIEASSRLGMVEVDMVSHTNEGYFDSDPPSQDIHASYRVADGFNPHSVAIPMARTGGVTTALITPGGGLISGTAAIYELAGTFTPETPAAAMVVNLGLASRKSGQGSRGMALARLREIFADATLYRKQRRNFQSNRLRPLAASHLDLEALRAVLAGKVPLIVSVNRAADIRATLGLRARWKKIRIVISGGTEAWMVADLLAKAKVPVLLDPTANLPSNFDRMRVRNDNATLLAKAGVSIAITQLGEWANTRNLRQVAGIAVAYGLSREQALAAITTTPAKIFGLRKHGALRAGNRANIVIWSGDPLELSSRVEQMFIDGSEVPLETRQNALREKYREL